MKKWMNILTGLVLALAMVLTLTACQKEDTSGKEPVETKTTASEITNDDMEYMSPDGWRVLYNAKTIESMEQDEHAAQFVYLGESAGTNMVEIKYIADKQPEEVLYEVTEEWGDQEDIKRSEGIFPGTDDKWGYWRTLDAKEGTSGLGMTAIAGEYNGGVLLFVVTSHMSGDEETDMAASDALSNVIDSITYKEFKDQTMYDYFPGTYKADDDNKEYKSLVLNKDHTGVLTDAKGNKTKLTWGSIELMAEDGSFTYEYTIEGDDLYVNTGNNWVEFEK